MSNRIKARLTVLVGLLLVIVWRLVAQQAAVAVRIPFPPLLPEQIIIADQAEIEDCAVAVLAVHTDPLSVPIPAEQAKAVLTAERAELLVRSVATAYLQRDFQTPARVSEPQMVQGEFFGTERLAWGQVWQPPGFDGTYTDTAALIIYVDAVAAVPLVVYADVPVLENVTGCVVPPPSRDQTNLLDWGLPVIVGIAVMLIAVGAVLELYRRSVVAVSE